MALTRIHSPGLAPTAPVADSAPWMGARLSAAQFERLARFVVAESGIQLPPSKHTMLESRLRKRLRTLELPDFESYVNLAFAPGSNEVPALIEAVTTNKTDFFREPEHFDVLTRHALPTLEAEQGAGRRRPLRVWSAASSTGEEPYTLAMLLADHEEENPGFQWSILASDINATVLAHARRGVYDEDRVAPVPDAFRHKYLLRSKNPRQDAVRIVPQLRAKVELRQINLLHDDYGIRDPVDILFCRNVFIYFDRATQEAILRKFCRRLSPGGFLFLGHSESINGMKLPLTLVRPTVFRNRAVA